MLRRELRGRDEITLDLVGVAGLSAFLLGLTWLQASEQLGFDPAGALDGVLSQLPVTLPAAILVLAAAALEVGAGLVLARLVRRRAFDSIAEALIAAMVAAVLKDTFLLGTLGAVGWFRQPALLAVDVALIALPLLVPRAARWTRPLLDVGDLRGAVGRVGSWTIGALVAIVWAGPLILQLASPVAPFIDVLPNYVSPVEHLRTFGSLSPLTATQSPIHGPSRSVLGFDGLLGALAAMTDLPGGLTLAAFALPETVLVAAGASRLATAVRGAGEPAPGAWALLAFALTQPFARLTDARGTVVVVPLVCLGLALAAESLRREATVVPDADPWRGGRGAAAGLALGAATLVHPVVGLFAVLTVALAALARPRELGPVAFAAAIGASLLALPQLATMLAVTLPTITLGAWVPLSIAIALSVGRLVTQRDDVRDRLVRLATVARPVVAILLVLAAVLAFGAGLLRADALPAAAGRAVELALASSGILLAAIGVGIATGSRGARTPLVLGGLVVGVSAVALVELLRTDLGFLGDTLRFELPKTVHYWLSTIAAAGAATALATVWASGRPLAARGAAIAAFVVAAALPLRLEPIDAYHLGEHRYAETFAIDLHFAERGFWIGYPDRRTVVDGPRQEILDAVRAEIDAGRLLNDTPVLHLARSFQQWVATPLGVFDGVTETVVSLDPERSQHTVGGRLFGFEDLPGFLASGAFPYVVLEPDGLDPGLREQVLAAGYVPIFANEQGEVFRIAH